MNGGNNSRQNDHRASQAARYGMQSPLPGPRPMPITPRAATVLKDNSYSPFTSSHNSSTALQVKDHNPTCLKAARPPEKPPTINLPTSHTNMPIGDHHHHHTNSSNKSKQFDFINPPLTA